MFNKKKEILELKKRNKEFEKSVNNLLEKVKETNDYIANLSKFVDKDSIIFEETLGYSGDILLTFPQHKYIITYIYDNRVKQVVIMGEYLGQSFKKESYSILKNTDGTIVIRIRDSYYLINKSNGRITDITKTSDLIKE